MATVINPEELVFFFNSQRDSKILSCDKDETYPEKSREYVETTTREICASSREPHALPSTPSSANMI